MNKKPKNIILFIIISLATGGASALITGTFSESYQNLSLPSFAPAPIVFPIVWTVLYILMGISAGTVASSASSQKETALTWYAFQLAANFLWSIIFFVEGWYFFGFLWILLLLWLVVSMTVSFFKASPFAAYLQAPYIVWLVFAAILNFFTAMMN